jgi:hypothetical protein
MGTGGGEGAKFWMSVLVCLKNRAVRDVFFLVCDGLKGLPPGGGERLAANYRANMHPSFDQELCSVWCRGNIGMRSGRI